jgi:hypothetical protein
MTVYRHTQVGRTIIAGLLICTVVTLPLGWLIGRGGLIVPFVLMMTTVLFWKMTITIEDGILRARFGPGPIWKRCRLAEIADCQATKIRWWWGWGVHLTPRGWLFNVGGWDAVEITTRNGRRFLLGTDQPAELVAAIRRSASAR